MLPLFKLMVNIFVLCFVCFLLAVVYYLYEGYLFCFCRTIKKEKNDDKIKQGICKTKKKKETNKQKQNKNFYTNTQKKKADTDSDTSTYDVRIEYKCISRSLTINRAISQELLLTNTQKSIAKQLKLAFGFHATYGIFEITNVFVNQSISILNGYYINGT